MQRKNKKKQKINYFLLINIIYKKIITPQFTQSRQSVFLESRMQEIRPKLQTTLSSLTQESNDKQSHESTINTFEQKNLELNKKISDQAESINQLNQNYQKLLLMHDYYKQLYQYKCEQSYAFQQKFKEVVYFNKKLLQQLDLHEYYFQVNKKLSEQEKKQLQLLKKNCQAIQGFQFDKDPPKMPNNLYEQMSQMSQEDKTEQDKTSLWQSIDRSQADDFQSQQFQTSDKPALQVGLQTLIKVLNQTLAKKKVCVVTQTHQVTFKPIPKQQIQQVDAFQVKQLLQTTTNSEKRDLQEISMNGNQFSSLDQTIQAFQTTFQELYPIERGQFINRCVEQLPENQRNAVQWFFKNHNKKHNKRHKMKKSPQKYGKYKKLTPRQFQKEIKQNLKDLHELNKKYRPHKQHKKGHTKGK